MKKNLRKIPLLIRARLNGMMGSRVAVGCAKYYAHCEIQAEALKRFGITIQPSTSLLGAEGESFPSADTGRYSKWNLLIKEVKRRDLPKEERLIEGEAPDFGGYGTHPISYYRSCYRIERIRPRKQKLYARVIRVVEGGVVVAFKLSDSLDKASPKFEQLLLESLNVLQENVGRCGVESADTLMEEYDCRNVIHVDWQLFPPGHYSKDQIARIVMSIRHDVDPDRMSRTLKDRMECFESIGARQTIYGQGFNSAYIGGMLADDFVVFDNIDYGNAVYIIHGDWRSLTKLPRMELLAKFPNNVKRILHGLGWQEAVRREIMRLRHERCRWDDKNCEGTN